MFRAHVLIIRRSKLHYTACSVWWYQRLCNAILTSWWWAHVLETCLLLLPQLYNSLWVLACSIIPLHGFLSCAYSKHVEAWNKLIVKQKCCVSSWLITQINILRRTVSKTSKCCVSIWLITEINILRRTVSKTSKCCVSSWLITEINILRRTVSKTSKCCVSIWLITEINILRRTVGKTSKCCVSSWFNNWDKYTETHGQQNVKIPRLFLTKHCSFN